MAQINDIPEKLQKYITLEKPIVQIKNQTV